MKVVLIHGQNHKGSSYNIGRMIANTDNLDCIERGRSGCDRHRKDPRYL